MGTRTSLRTGLLIVLSLLALNVRAADEEGNALFNGKSLEGWKLRHPNESAVWTVVRDVKLDPGDKSKLIESERNSTEGVLFRNPAAHGVDLVSEKEFGDCEAHCEFMVPQGSNSGFYLMGEYEVQILSETYGKKDSELDKGDCGAIYNTKAPTTQAETAPGQWQTYDITFRAPRFDAHGKKVENARFVSVIFNGKKIHENVDVPAPTGGQLGEERAKGPILLQGDHGIVAFKNIRVKELELK